jgi:poly-gamma-glutamate synthesis protein (capsule biosynthesis protein)
LDGQAPIDVEFDPAIYPLAVPIGLIGRPDFVAAVLGEWSGPETNRDDSRITHVAMTGPAGMRRAVADRMERYGLTYPAEETGPILQAVDIAHMSNENAFAPDCPTPDPLDSDNVCNRDEYVELMTWMGIDVNEMTGNHLNDWGAGSLLHTFDLYEELDIKTYGGGRNLEHARQPLLMEHHGNQIAFVGCNPVGPELAWARGNYPGSLPCEDFSSLKEQIGQLEEEGYLVIVTLQYNEDYRYDPRPEQQELFHDLAESGAMAVSGSQGHHPQGFAFHGDSFIHYGLGNLLADQMWSLATRQTFIDIYLIYDGRLLNVDLWTGLNEDYARIRQMMAEERRELLESVFAVSER